MDKKSEKEATEPETQNEAWKLGALRTIIDNSFDATNNLDNSLELVSLQDIILAKANDTKVFEAYIKLQENDDMKNENTKNAD